ncbi:MAG: hypothetical protein ABIP79_06120 [Chitinophagaceae bacterium]
MKKITEELEVDFIGGQNPMTKDEELRISKFIHANKEKRKLQRLRNSKLKTLRKDKQTS